MAIQSQHATSILVVEDNPINQRVAVWILNRLGNQTEVANDGREALYRIGGSYFDLVLMDCQMPEMDGYEATREIRRREQGTDRRLPIVAMTANALEGEDWKCYEAGMDGYLAKPVKRDQIAAALDRWLAPPPAPDLETGTPNQDVDQSLIDHLHELEQTLNPAIVQTLIGSFLSNAAQQIAALDVALAQQDGPTVARIAHNLKGSAGNMGATPLARACEDLERAAYARQPDGIHAAITCLHTRYADLRPRLEAFQTIGAAT